MRGAYSVSVVLVLALLFFFPVMVKAQIMAPEKFKKLALKVLPMANGVYLESDSVLQVSVEEKKKNFSLEAKKICELLRANKLNTIKIVFVENGDTGLGKCNCSSLKTGFQKVADRKYGYYYFAE